MTMNPIKMMIVDDERIILESLETLVDWKSVGVEVVGTADNGADAISMALKLYPDIILSDISMPTCTGLEMLKSLREQELRVEVIFITAYGKFDYAKEAIKFGAYDYILKPIDENILLEAVSRCVKKIRDDESRSYGNTGTENPAEILENEQSAYSGVKHLVSAALEYIHENFHKEITLSQVANHLYITPTYLSKLFSTEMQESFSQYLISHRMKIAKELLRDTHHKVYEVAAQVGYTDIAHFSKIFKRITGQTPKEYRNRKFN